MTVSSSGRPPRWTAAYSPPNPPPTITTSGVRSAMSRLRDTENSSLWYGAPAEKAAGTLATAGRSRDTVPNTDESEIRRAPTISLPGRHHCGRGLGVQPLAADRHARREEPREDKGHHRRLCADDEQ